MTAPNRNHGKTQTQWERMCLNKTRYTDEYTARAGAFHLFTFDETRKLRSGPVPQKLWVYKCANCRGWHMTKSQVRGSVPVTAEGMFASEA